MNVVELRVSNFAKLKAVTIRPDGAVVQITGKNSSGKTSTLNAIWTALVGRAAAPPRPIHEGAERAELHLDLGQLAITRTFGRGKHGELTTSLSVVDESGAKITRTPQAVIDAVLGDLSFDPLAFSKLKPDEKFAKLRALVPGVDFDAIARKRKDAFEARTDANRQHKDATARASGIKLPPGPEPAAVDVAVLSAEFNKAQAHNAKVAQAEQKVAEIERNIETWRAEAEELRSRAATCDERAELAADNAEALRAALVPAMETAAIVAAIGDAQKVGEARALHQRRREHIEAAEASRLEAEQLDATIGDLDEEVRSAISAAKLPAGLALDAETSSVMLNGRPFEAAGTAEKIVASAQVAMALNPDLKVMLIDEGSELDSGMLVTLGNLAEANDFQVWVARVEEGEGGAGFRIEDGAVREAK